MSQKIKYRIVLYVLPVFRQASQLCTSMKSDCKFSMNWSSLQQLSWDSWEWDHQHSNTQYWTDKLSHLVTEQREVVTATVHLSYDKANLESVKQTRTLFRSHMPSSRGNTVMIKANARISRNFIPWLYLRTWTQRTLKAVRNSCLCTAQS